MLKRLLSLGKAVKAASSRPLGNDLTDYHCHILPGIDDGAYDWAESLKMAGALASLGFSTVYCTPHCQYSLYDNKPETVREMTATLQKKIDGEKINLKLFPGMEYLVGEEFEDDLNDLLGLGGTGFLLIETSKHSHKGHLLEVLYKIKLKTGFTPMIAHPERTPHIIEDEACLDKIRRMGCKFQLNLGSFAGLYGSEAKQWGLKLSKMGMADYMGSDSHNLRQINNFAGKGLLAWQAANNR